MRLWSQGWDDDRHVDPYAVTQTNGDRLDLGYATEVLYAAWEWKAALTESAEIEGTAAAA
ncbi:hypothetical protein [Gordonia humi]|uniref:Uncharacterized protein n=1 Tax=Gordonia humi TaxID=686429 RepID=A0A840F1X7_9ACTN|nr:hypothetical protein [Gordonia humi]MBB4135389.1 hypothetical protein [Gordonia humi]